MIKKRILAITLAMCLLLGLVPGTGISGLISSAQAVGETGAFGIPTPTEMSAEEQKQSEITPFGTKEGQAFPLFVKSELFASYGWDGNKSDKVRNYLKAYDRTDNSGGNLPTVNLNSGEAQIGYNENGYSNTYTATATDGIDLGSGKEDHVAVLGYNAKSHCLELGIADRNGSKKNIVNVAQGWTIDFLDDVEIHQMNGFLSVACGDFDGDGLDSAVVFQTGAGTLTPNILEYKVEKDGTVYNSAINALDATNGPFYVVNNVFKLLNSGADAGGAKREAKNAPKVQLEAADVDKDGYDELVATVSMNDTYKWNDLKHLGTQVFIYDKLNGAWTLSARFALKDGLASKDNSAAAQSGRMVWGTSSVGNVIASDNSGAQTDFPEIVTAGLKDGESKDFNNINVVGDDTIVYSIIRCTGMKSGTQPTADGNYQGSYEQISYGTVAPNEFTKSGFYESEDVSPLLQTKCFHYLDSAHAEGVFISGSVYTYNANLYKEENRVGGLTHLYTFSYFTNGDKGIGSHAITNAQVEAVTAGNFDGNEEGREQIVCAPLLKQSGANNGFCWLYVYGYYGEAGSGSWQEQGKDYYPLFIDRKGRSYVSLTDFDYDNDSTIVKYESVEKQWSDPEVMAILEAAPYFQDIGQGISSTNYQIANSSGSSNGYSKSVTSNILLGYEKTGKIAGGGLEIDMENNYTWATNQSRTITYSINYANTTDKNQVVVYRTPTLVYHYTNINTGEPVYLARPLDTVTSMIPVAEYNAEAAGYNMQLIDEANYCDPGHPATYPATVAQIESMGGKDVKVFGTPSDYSHGIITKTISLANETESSYNYEFSVSFTAYGLLFGAKAGGGLGIDTNETTATIDGTEITRSGSVEGMGKADYGFNWDFATWNTDFNGLTIPVCGYTVTNTASPPAPGKNLDITSITTDSLTLQWGKGDRPASKYNIYRIIEDSTDPYLYLGSLPGNQDRYTFPLKGLDPDTSYTFVVRGATGNKESVDSLSATARTAMVGDSVTISDVADAQVAPGESAKFSAAVASCERFSSLQRFWQKREANNGVWKDLDGEHSTSLIVSNVTKDMDGDQYRLKIKATTTSASYGYYYSNAATLTVSTTATQAELTVSGTGGMGTLDSPYSGSASYTTQTKENATITATVQATFAEKKGLVYQSGSAYIGRLDDGKEGTGSTYYALTKNGTEYTSGVALTQSARWLNGSGAEVTLPGKTQPYAEAKQQDGYTAIAKWNRTDAAYEILWYQNGEYYTAATTEAGTTYTPAEEVSQDGIFLDTILYAGEDGTVIRAMDTYYAIDAAKTVTTVFLDDYVTIGTTIYPLASLAPVQATEQRAIPVLKTMTTPGSALTLSAVLRKANSKQALTGTEADFVITDQSTGTPQIIHATSGSDGKITASWTAGSPGLYSIQVSLPATAALDASLSDAKYYYAYGNPDEDQYRLGLNVNGQTVAGETAYGSQINLVPQQWQNKTWNAADSALRVSEQGSTTSQPITGKSDSPTKAGKYLFSMLSGENVLASAALTVTPVAVTVTPVLNSETPTSASEVTLRVEGDMSAQDKEKLANALEISCPYFEDTAMTGAFTVSLTWKDNTDAAYLRGAYSITLGSASFYKMANTAQVSYAVEGSGGKLLGEVDTNTGTASMASGSSQSQGATLYFTATPDAGYQIQGWKINGERLDDSNDHYTILNVGKGQQLQIEGFDPDLDAKNGALLVQVAFTNQASHITYTAGEGGRIAAKTSKGSDVPSDSSLAYDATVLFTATPEAGKMVTKWMVATNGGEPTRYTWPGTEKPYLENTLALRKLDQAEYTVYAEFGDEEMFTVKAPTLVNSRGNAVHTGSITMKTTNGNEIKNGDKLPKGKAVIYTVTLDDKNFTTLNGWEVSKDGGKTWERSGTSNATRGYTCYAGEGESLQVRAVVSSAQSYPLTWRIEGAPEENEGFALTAASGDTTLTSGAEYPVNTPVTFALTLPSDYEVTGWTGAKQDPENSQSATLTLTKETEVVVTVAKRAPSDDDKPTPPDNNGGDWNLDYQTCDRGETCPLADFADLDPNAWYHDGVHFALANGVLEGCGDEDFRLDTPTNRAMLAVILWRMNGCPDAGDDTNFPDVPDQSWYEKAAAWAAEHGYIEGDDTGRFAPESPLTREQMATILWRYAQSKGYDVSVGESTSLEAFADAEDISDYAVPAMQWAVGVGLITGQPDGDTLCLTPTSSTTRAEAASMIQRFCQYVWKR